MQRRRKTTTAAILAVLLGSGLALAQAQPPTAPTGMPDFRELVRHATDRVFPAVVYVKCIRENFEEGKKTSQEVSGSGVLISPAGEALTNWHVVTVRDMTYEVRRYFQRAADDPGVIVSKVEQGSKASVTGMKPYEIITHVNDEPITSAANFEKILASAEGEIRLNVKRMTQGRIVKTRL